jgi:SET domain-containing protein
MTKSLIFNKLQNHNVYVGKSQIHGWGIFARENFKQNDITTQTPILFLDNTDNNTASNVYQYTYKDNNGIILPLGFCSLYNHSFDPNTAWYIDYNNNVMIHYAIRNIFKNEELTHNYGEENANGFK